MDSVLSVDCPTTVTISPSGPYELGDVLNCSSDGYPTPKYEWTDSDGLVVSSASTTRLLGGWFNLTCTATSDFRTPCTASSSVTGNITGKSTVHVLLLTMLTLTLCLTL